MTHVLEKDRDGVDTDSRFATPDAIEARPEIARVHSPTRH
jgi:hypothetical protein